MGYITFSEEVFCNRPVDLLAPPLAMKLIPSEVPMVLKFWDMMLDSKFVSFLRKVVCTKASFILSQPCTYIRPLS